MKVRARKGHRIKVARVTKRAFIGMRQQERMIHVTRRITGCMACRSILALAHTRKLLLVLNEVLMDDR